MNPYSSRHPVCLTLLVGCFALTGCFNFKQVVDPARYFVLAPKPNPPRPAHEPRQDLGVGIGPVTLAGYLDNNQLAVRSTDHEITYMDHFLWAERLDKSIPRVLAVNLSLLLGTDRVQMGSWGRDDVSMEVYLTVHRFEWNENGQVTLEAQWQLRKPGAETMAASGFTQIQGNGPALRQDADQALAILNDLLFQLSQQIATKIEALTR